MNFKTMVDRVKYTMGMQEITSHDEITGLIKPYLNEGVVDLIVRTRPFTRVINLTLTADTPIHDMASDILSLLDIEHPDFGFLQRLSREDATNAQGYGQPGFAYEEPLLWVSPVPATDLVIRAYGIFRPTPMANDTDDCATGTYGGIPPEFHPAIINYACWKAAEYTQHEGSQLGEKWRIAYEGREGDGGDISRIKKILSKRVTPQAARRRDLTGNLGSVGLATDYIGA